MAIKNFGLTGVASSIQLGKNGGIFDYNSGVLRARNAANSALINFQAASPVANDDVATKQYVDGLVAGGVKYKGTVDASAADPASAGVVGTPENGDQYKVTTAGSTAFGFQLNVGDFVIYNGVTWDKIDATDPTVTGTSNRITVTATGDTSYAVDIASTYVGQSSITTLGTITTGTWNGSTISTSYGGTGLTSLGTSLQQLRVNAGGTGLEYFTPSTVNAFTNFTDGVNTATPDSETDTLSFTGTPGISVTLDDSTDSFAFALDLVSLNDGTALTIDQTNDLFVMYDNSTGDIVKVTAQQIVDAAVDKTRITNTAGTTYIDTDETANTITANVNGDQVFVVKNTASTANARLEIETGNSDRIELSIASNGATNADLHLNPLGTGSVVIGGTGAAVLEANADEDLRILAGEGTNGGDLVLKAGHGSSTSGTIKFVDNSATENLIFEIGAGNAATNLELTSSATGVTLEAKGSATNIDLILGSKTPGNNVGLVKAVSGYDAALTTNYSTNSDETFVTLGTLKTQIAAAAGDPGVRRGTFTTTASTNIGTALPTTAYVGRAIVKVTTAYTSGGTFTLKAGATTLATDSDVDLQTLGTYIIDIYDGANQGTNQLAVEIGGSPAAGAASISIEYKVA